MGLISKYKKESFSPEEESVNNEILGMIKKVIPTSFVAVIFLNYLLSFVVVNNVPVWLLISWFCLLCSTFAFRYALYRLHSQTETESTRTHNQWLFMFRLATISTGLVWAVGLSLIVLLQTGFTGEQYLFVSVITVGFFAGAMLVLSFDKLSMLGSCLPSLVPLGIIFIEVANEVVLPIAVSLILFLLYIYSAAKRQQGAFFQNLRLRIQAVEDEERFKKILDYSPIAASVIDVETQTKVFANQRYHEALNYFEIQDSKINRLIFDNLSEKMLEQADGIEPVIDRLLALKNVHNPEDIKWVLASFYTFQYQHKPAILCWFYDITERKRMEEAVSHMAYYDALTDLPNRSLFTDRLKRALIAANRDEQQVALMYIDLDGFKTINDQHGHDCGDGVLIESANRMLQVLRASDTVARLGGDEFAAVMPVHDEHNALGIAEKLRDAISQPIAYGNMMLNVSCSIGIAIYPEHGETEHTLITHADEAMYQVKRQGRNAVAIYAAVQQKDAKRDTED
jgi:diguanylate cyclase (GGDEF)-like protein/PAS domain S-box-containing protein